MRKVPSKCLRRRRTPLCGRPAGPGDVPVSANHGSFGQFPLEKGVIPAPRRSGAGTTLMQSERSKDDGEEKERDRALSMDYDSR